MGLQRAVMPYPFKQPCRQAAKALRDRLLRDRALVDPQQPFAIDAIDMSIRRCVDV